MWSSRWDWFHKPIHVVAHVLHPLWRNEEQYENEELEQGLQDYFEKWASGDVQMLRRLEDELLLFRNRSLSFGSSTALLRDTQLQPVSWWEKYGSSAPTLVSIMCIIRESRVHFIYLVLGNQDSCIV